MSDNVVLSDNAISIPYLGRGWYLKMLFVWQCCFYPISRAGLMSDNAVLSDNAVSIPYLGRGWCLTMLFCPRHAILGGSPLLSSGWAYSVTKCTWACVVYTYGVIFSCTPGECSKAKTKLTAQNRLLFNYRNLRLYICNHAWCTGQAATRVSETRNKTVYYRLPRTPF